MVFTLKSVVIAAVMILGFFNVGHCDFEAVKNPTGKYQVQYTAQQTNSPVDFKMVEPLRLNFGEGKFAFWKI